uniref:C-type lectin domain-containing protein n=1 Tax=Anabas testudineus TaxID=64144 RepID=A0A3Q1H6Y7_ANATE
MYCKSNFVFYLTLSSFSSRCKTTCPDGWIKFRWSCYFHSTESGSWTTGRANCRTRGAHLVVIHSAEEQTFLSEFTMVESWIGLTDRDKEGTWNWVDGTPLTVKLAFTTWTPRHSPLGEEDCAHIIAGVNSLKNWNDLSCDTSLRWILRKSHSPGKGKKETLE